MEVGTEQETKKYNSWSEEYHYYRPPILEFIKNFKEGHDVDALVEAFTRGDCYHFSAILKNLFPEGRIVYDMQEGHFSLELNGRYYDITGSIPRPLFPLYWDEHCNDEGLYGNLICGCVYKIDYSRKEEW